MAGSEAPVATAGRKIAPLFPTVAASYLGYAMMGTLFVPMLMSRTDGYLPPDTSLAARTTTIGLILALYPLGQFLGNPLLGSLSDRYGRRPVVLASTAATILCYVGVAIALTVKSLLLLAPFLLLCGLVEATLALTMSAIADVTNEAERPRYIGFLYATTSLAYVAGPLLGGLMAEFVGYALPFWIVLGALVVVLIWLQFAFAETQPVSARRAVPLLASLSSLTQVITDQKLRRKYLGNFLVFVAAFGFWRLITIYLVDEWGLSVGPVTACYAALAVLSGLGNLVLMPRLVGRVAMGPLAFVTLLGGAMCMAGVVVPYALGVPGSLFVAVALGSVTSLCMALSLSAVAALLSAAAPADRQGTVLGNNAALVVLGEIVGVTGGSLLAGIDPAVPIVVLACVAALAPLVLGVRPARRADSLRPA
jgi:MFS transporter, DHA1 family, tetracycline resistance protein